MKKYLVWIIVLALSFTAFMAAAEPATELAAVQNGDTRDFDNDGTEETLCFILGEPDENHEITTFMIGVGDHSYTVDSCWNLSGNIYALNLGRGLYYEPEMCWGTLFMVSEYGPSDDPVSYCYLYTGSILYDVGMIPALPEGMTVDANGKILTRIRANHIGTWARDAEYTLASGLRWTEDGDYIESYRLCEVPHDIYAMGMIVETKRDITLLKDRYSKEPSVTIASGKTVILAASDDVSWLYITDPDENIGGWLEMTDYDYSDCVILDGEYIDVFDAFENIFCAD